MTSDDDEGKRSRSSVIHRVQGLVRRLSVEDTRELYRWISSIQETGTRTDHLGDTDTGTAHLEHPRDRDSYGLSRRDRYLYGSSRVSRRLGLVRSISSIKSHQGPLQLAARASKRQGFGRLAARASKRHQGLHSWHLEHQETGIHTAHIEHPKDTRACIAGNSSIKRQNLLRHTKHRNPHDRLDGFHEPARSSIATALALDASNPSARYGQCPSRLDPTDDAA